VPTPPNPAALVHRVTTPFGTREDPFYWLRDDTRSDPRVLAHLRAETAYAEAVLQPAKPLIDELYREIVSRIKEDDSSVPVRYRRYWYASRFVSGEQYPVIGRRADQAGAAETVLLDCNALALGQPFFQPVVTKRARTTGCSRTARTSSAGASSGSASRTSPAASCLAM